MPELSRRSFIARSGAAAGALALTGAAACSGDDDDRGAAAPGTTSRGTASTAPFDPGDWDSVRAQFPLSSDRRHFAAFVLAAHPRPVADAIERHRAGLDEDTETYLATTEQEAETAVRTEAAEYLGARPDEVALTDSTTMGLGLVYGGMRLAAGQEVLATEHDFYSTHQALALRAARTGARFRKVRLYDDPSTATVDEIVGRLTREVTPATRAVAVTWVHSGTGVKLPVRAIADALTDVTAGRGDDDRVLLCVDGVHGLGVEDVGIADLACDFLVAGTHKWLFGPRGTGIVWGRADAWPAVDGVIPPFEPGSYQEWLDGARPGPMSGVRLTPGGYHSFEHRWALAEAFRFHLDIGKDAVARRTHEQATQLKGGLAELPGVRVVTPMADELSAGIVCLEVAGSQPADVLGTLAAHGVVASITPYREQYVRLGPSIVTSPDDVDAVVDALRP
jgi:selenocysteine lyase/cysteine desulfurase